MSPARRSAAAVRASVNAALHRVDVRIEELTAQRGDMEELVQSLVSRIHKALGISVRRMPGLTRFFCSR